MNFKQILKNRYIKYTIYFVFCISLIFSIFVLRKVSFIGDGDSYNQTYPVFVYIGDYIRSILQGEYKTFDFRIGYGEDVISVLNYYGFGDVFSILAALCPVECSEIAYNIVMILKLYFCGIAFLVYARRYINSDNVVISGALMYSLSVYVLFRGMGFWMFINPVILYPLILSGIDEICVENKKVSWILVFSVWLQTLNGFYFLYINVILTIVYFIVINLCRRDVAQNKRNVIFRTGITILWQALLGVGAGAVIFLPGFIGYLNSSRTGRGLIFKSIREYFLFDINFYINNLRSVFIPNVWESITTMPSIIVLACVGALFSKKIKLQFKALAICLVMLYNIPFFGSVMNGFSEVSDRWYYAVILFLGMLGCVGMDEEKSCSKWIRNLFIFISLAIMCFDIFTNGMQMQVIIRDIILYAAVLVSVYVYESKYCEILLPWVCILLIVNGLLVMGPNEFGGKGYSWAFESSGKITQDTDRCMDALDINIENGFERLDVYDGISLSTSLIKDYYGTSEYFSILNNNVSEFYQELAISPGLRTASWILKGIDGREEVMSILSVSQYTDFITSEMGINSYIKENECYLPLGFTYDKWINRNRYEQLTPLQKQKVMLEGVVLEEDCSLEIELVCDNVKTKSVDYHTEYENIENNNNVIATSADSRIRCYVETQEDSVYICLKDFVVHNLGVHEIYVGNKNLQLRNQEDGYYMGIDEFWVNVTELKEENGYKYFDISFLEECEFSLPEIEIYEHSISKDIVEERKEDVLENVKWNNNQLTGQINVQEPKILFMSIPYSSGWKAYVDGNEAEILRANVGFSAVEVPEGEHEVCFVYTTPGFKIGLVCSIASLLIMAFIFVNQKHFLKRNI